MVIQKNINIQDDKLLNGLMPVLEIINQIEGSEDGEITIDFQSTRFVSPLFVLPLMVYLHGSRRQINCTNISPYLDTVHFPKGTLLGSYRKQAGNEIESDLEAIQAANRGISTKNRPEAENRGYGIITSKKMLIDGLGGHYIMLSGEAIHLKSRELDKFLLLPQQIRWEGTIIAFRIPYSNNTFSYTHYIE